MTQTFLCLIGPELQFDKEEDYESLVQKILPLLKDKNYKDATVLVRKADYMAGNQDLRYSTI